MGKYARPPVNVSLKRRRLICSLDDEYLIQTFTNDRNRT